LYAYRCTQCGHRFEKIQNFSAEPETECPECHGVLERPLTAPGLHFKGAGWYVNDYAAKSSSSGSESDSKAEAKADAKSDAKAAANEAKPAFGTSESAASAPAATPAPSSAPSSTAASSTS